MHGHAVWPVRASEFLYRNRIGALSALTLLCFGVAFGSALYRALYDMLLSARAAFPSASQQGGLPLGTVLLWTILPALLFLCVMLLCAGARRLLPLWGLALLLAGARSGLAAGAARDMEFAVLIALRVPTLIAQAGLAVLSLDCKTEELAFDAYGVTERFLGPATAYLAMTSVLETLSTALLMRRLLD